MYPSHEKPHSNSTESPRVFTSFHALTRFPSLQEFVSSEISQTLRDIMENPNRLNTLRTNLKTHIILTPYITPNRHRTRRSRKSWISQRIRKFFFFLGFCKSWDIYTQKVGISQMIHCRIFCGPV